MRPHQHILDWLSDVASDLHAVRHDIHAHPELGFEENRTSALVAQSLKEWGYEVHTGIGKTGVVGVLRNGGSPRRLGLRARAADRAIEQDHASLIQRVVRRSLVVQRKGPCLKHDLAGVQNARQIRRDGLQNLRRDQ